MELKIIHFYPDLMSLYGSYANVAVLKRKLEAMGNTVTVETVDYGQDADIAEADFLFMGAGTERRQKAALADFVRYAEAVKTLAKDGTSMLFAGTAMELLGKTISEPLERIMEERRIWLWDSSEETVDACEGVNGFTAVVAAPILCEGDVLGLVLFLSTDSRAAGETEYKLAQTVAAFLGKNMEN